MIVKGVPGRRRGGVLDRGTGARSGEEGDREQEEAGAASGTRGACTTRLCGS